MTYAILRNNRRATKVTFNTYESARQYLRKILRKMGREAYITEMHSKGYIHSSSASPFAVWDDVSRNPTNFTELGYAIRQLQ